MMVRSASGSRGWFSSVARRSNSSVMRSRSCGVMVLAFRDDPIDVGSRHGKGMTAWGKISWGKGLVLRTGETHGRASGQRYAMARQQVRKCFPHPKGLVAVPQRGGRIEPRQLGIHEAGVTHDQTAIRQLVEETGKQGGKIGVVVEFIGPRKGRIGAQAARAGALLEVVAQEI